MSNPVNPDTLAQWLTGRFSDRKGRKIVFLRREVFPLFQHPIAVEDSSLFFALSNRGLAEDIPSRLPAGRILCYSSPDFIDRAKLQTEGQGFENVIVLDEEPEAVKRALGVARVFGTVYLLVSPRGPVTVDLHNTIHYKSLRVIGGVDADFPGADGS